jgi:endonuclease-3
MKVALLRQQRIRIILPMLRKLYPDARCSLNYKNPLELLVATILSAQCTDERVNKVTVGLFAKYHTAADFAKVSQEVLEKEIQSTVFFRNKAKNIRAMARTVLEVHDGKVPRTMEELTRIAGVGRKTANVVLGNAFGIDVGIVVDTHVARISGRLGLTKQTDPVKIERDLMEIVPKAHWTLWPHLLIQHGRTLCMARNPKCESCPLLPYCPAGQKIVKQRSRN